MNQVTLSAVVLEAKPMRYTPAGLPALDMVLQHESDVIEAGRPRHVELSISARALGDMALILADVGLGTALKVAGFLAPSRKGSSRLILHIQQAEQIPVASRTVVV